MIIKASDIHKSFGQLEVLKGIDLEVEKGEIVAIVGASGAGKSTLLQILGTLSTPDSGSLEIDGTKVEMMSRDEAADFRCRKIGFVFQAHHLLPEFTAEENVMIPAMIAGVPRKKARERNVGWRIDYFLVSEGFRDRIVSTDIHNEIFGSDHCPVELVLEAS